MKPDTHDCALTAAERSLREIVEAGATNKVLRKEKLSDTIVLFELDNPLIARNAVAGQFVVVRPNTLGERIPLTISDADKVRGTITIIFQVVGRTTMELARIKEGECVPDVCGPLGTPSEIENYGTAICVGGGVGIAFLRPITKALKEAGNEVITILGAREKSLLILENEMRELSDELILTTDDGSYGIKGVVTGPIKEMLDSGRKIDYIFAIGPMPMMRAVAETTRPYGVKTVVSLDPIMINGTGMCGGCRVTVGGQTKFTCVDGPDFDGHEVDWDELKIRKAYYFAEEQAAKEMAAKEEN
ncbi:MAG TPA: sulfide/dihydroorotate dehydrogenase-like FAD/NAD-binding protein [Armatimonadota bacterium]|nr:sulfide/dihydroorotate dehydrogenase-like FAD/NAD-binding protein [Armatimonadota bacterium]